MFWIVLDEISTSTCPPRAALVDQKAKGMIIRTLLKGDPGPRGLVDAGPNFGFDGWAIPFRAENTSSPEFIIPNQDGQVITCSSNMANNGGSKTTTLDPRPSTILPFML